MRPAMAAPGMPSVFSRYAEARTPASAIFAERWPGGSIYTSFADVIGESRHEMPALSMRDAGRLWQLRVFRMRRCPTGGVVSGKGSCREEWMSYDLVIKNGTVV